VKETRYITREEAAQNFIKELGEDFVSFLGENPLPASIDVKLLAPYANADSMALLEKAFRTYPHVADVAYQKDLVFAVNQNIKKISLAILVFGILLFLIAITLINNTIRLTVYAKRFLIRTMQLVGAHNHFIRRPFLIKGISQGILSACLAMLLILAVIFLAEKQLEGLYSFFDIKILSLVYLLILISGILITWISTLLSVNKYLRIKTDHLYT
jgi:cell division transport system permease protein